MVPRFHIHILTDLVHYTDSVTVHKRAIWTRLYQKVTFSSNIANIMCHWIDTAFSQVKVVKDIWTEEDDGGKVRFATVQVKNGSKFLLKWSTSFLAGSFFAYVI